MTLHFMINMIGCRLLDCTDIIQARIGQTLSTSVADNLLCGGTNKKLLNFPNQVHLLQLLVFTACQRSCWKVMFLVMCVCQCVCPQRGPHITITYDTLDLIVLGSQLPPPPDMGHGNPLAPSPWFQPQSLPLQTWDILLVRSGSHH